MELKLNETEIKAALLEYAQREFPGVFSSVEIVTNYGSTAEYAIFTEREPTKLPTHAPLPIFNAGQCSPETIERMKKSIAALS